MKRTIFIITMILLSSTAFASAQIAKKLSTYDEMEYPISAKEIWKIVGNFNGMNTWHPAVKKSEITKGKNNTQGAIRVLTLENGEKLHEKLLSYNSKKMSMSYDIHKGEYPASYYVGLLKVLPGGNGKSKIVWTATLIRKDTDPNPKEGEDDVAATLTTKKIHKDGLENLKKMTSK